MAHEVIVQAAYMTGDMFGVAAALALDPDLRVLVVSDTNDRKNVEKMVAFYKQSEQAASPPKANDAAYYASLIRTETDVGRLNSIRAAAALPLTGGVPRRVTPARTRVATLEATNSRTFYKSLHEPGHKDRAASLETVRKKFGFARTSDFRIKAMGHSTAIVQKNFAAERTIQDNLRVHKKLTDRWEIEDFDELGIQRFLSRKGIITTGKYAFVWIRQSGVNGGAHPELDSARAAWTQLIDALDKSITPVIVGDRFPSMDGLSKTKREIRDLTEFWKDIPFCLYTPGQKVLDAYPTRFLKGEGRRAQFTLFSYMRRAGYKVVHVGMRSGVLESVALMGQSVVYMEQIHNPQQARIEGLAQSMGTFERMELSALPIERGNAAYDLNRRAWEDMKYDNVGKLATAAGEHPRTMSDRIRVLEADWAVINTFAKYEQKFVELSRPVWARSYPSVNKWEDYKKNNALWWGNVTKALKAVFDIPIQQNAQAFAAETFTDTDLVKVTKRINTLLSSPT